jgi:hypothetical protein
MYDLCYIVPHDGKLFWCDTLRESGVLWIFVRDLADDVVAGAVAVLEGVLAVKQEKNKRNGVVSFAEAMLARKKDSSARTHEASDEDFCNLTPNVHELLTRILVDDKKVMEPATLLIFAREGSWHACISHKALKLKWWGEGGTIQAALAKLERSCLQEMGQEAPEPLGPARGKGGAPLDTGDGPR